MRLPLPTSHGPEKRYHAPGVMKEQDVRQRIESFLKRTARELIIGGTELGAHRVSRRRTKCLRCQQLSQLSS